MNTRLTVAGTVLAIALAACGGADTPDPPTPAPPSGMVELAVIPQATYDLAAGEDRRIIFGALLGDRTLIGGGTLDVRVLSLSSPDATEGTVVSQATASFLVVPGMAAPASPDQPAPIDGIRSSGVYQFRSDLPAAGFYGIQVTGVLADGRIVAGNAVVGVAAEHLVVAPGDDAPRTDNPTVDDGVPLVQLDSCAQEGNPCDPGNPDAPVALRFPFLHQASIADSIAAGRPLVVLVATPVFCVSRFCGPITETFAELAQAHGDRADFVHLEVWKDFQAQELNPAAAEWIQLPDGNAQEPWTFLVGADGTIEGRWGNVLDLADLEARLQALPVLTG
ncbi:MAG: hypothetical protein R3249_03040 [Nitriliruptorales bacterium]|nr:hypothetical protein [Nitriliruptorales bacterium]